MVKQSPLLYGLGWWRWKSSQKDCPWWVVCKICVEVGNSPGKSWQLAVMVAVLVVVRSFSGCFVLPCLKQVKSKPIRNRRLAVAVNAGKLTQEGWEIQEKVLSKPFKHHESCWKLQKSRTLDISWHPKQTFNRGRDFCRALLEPTMVRCEKADEGLGVKICGARKRACGGAQWRVFVTFSGKLICGSNPKIPLWGLLLPQGSPFWEIVGCSLDYRGFAPIAIWWRVGQVGRESWEDFRIWRLRETFFLFCGPTTLRHSPLPTSKINI